MQPGVTVALATVWLAGATGVLSATLYPFPPSLDQYSSQLPPNHHAVIQGPQGHPNWNFQDPSTDLLTTKIDQTSNAHQSIESSNLKPPLRPSLLYGSLDSSYGIVPGLKDSDFSFNDHIGVETKSENSRKVKEKLQKQIFDRKEAARQRDLLIAQQKKAAFERDDSDDYDSFQDQGPGSIEVYRLDLFEEDSLFGRKSLKKNEEATKARNKIEENILGQNEKVENEEETKKPEKKFKAKKIEAKNETKLVKNRKEAHKPQEKIEESEKEIQSEIVPSLYDLKTRFKTEKKFLNPNPNFSNQLEEDGENKSFGEGGVPELQVGCEGVEESFRDKRDASNGEDHEDTNIPLQPANIVDVHLIFQSEEDEDPQGVFYEDRDELLKLRKLEKELQNPSPPRGDIPIDLHEEYHKKEKLPVRGDLASTFLNGDSPDPNEDTYSYNGRKLLSISEISPLKRRKRELGGWDGVMWGYGEDEGILPDDELQTDEKRRDEEKRRVEAVRRREERRREEERRNHHRVSGDKREEDERIRKEHERRFEERERENKRREERIKLEEERRKSHEGRNEHNLEAERRRHGEKRRMQDEQRRMSDHRRNWPMDDQRLQEHRRREEEEKRKPEDERRRSDDERRRQENERRSDEHRRREDEHRGREDEHRRREDNREPEEIRRPEERRPEDERRHEEERRRHLERRRHEEERRRREEQRRREEVERRRTQNENLTPSNFMRPDRRQEEENEKKLKDYIQRNTPIVVSSRRHSGDSRAREAEDRRRNRPENLTRSRHPYENRHHHREPVWLEQKRAMESTREYNISGLKTPENERRHGPSPPSDVWRRSGMDDIRRRADVRRMEEEGRRLDRKRIDKEQEERRRDDRMKMELEGKRLEEEDLRRKSLMYEEERKWHERMRQQAERMRQEWMHESNRRSQSDRKPVWSRYQPFQSNNNEKGYQYPSPPDNLNNKGYQPPPDLNNKGYQPPPDLNNKGYQPPSDMNNKGYQPPPDMNNKGYQPPPDENNKGYQPPVDLNNKGYQPSRVNPEFERDRQRLDQERRRMEAERLARNRGPDDRYQEQKRREESVRSLEEQRRRQQEERLRALPVSATIIVRPGGSGTNSSSPLVFSRGGFGSEIDFPGISPNRKGPLAVRFPAPATRRPPVKGPGPCVWALVQCCPAANRVVSCFESLGCPGVSFDPNPCNPSLTQAARNEISKFYAASDQNSQK